MSTRSPVALTLRLWRSHGQADPSTAKAPVCCSTRQHRLLDKSHDSQAYKGQPPGTLTGVIVQCATACITAAHQQLQRQLVAATTLDNPMTVYQVQRFGDCDNHKSDTDSCRCHVADMIMLTRLMHCCLSAPKCKHCAATASSKLFLWFLP